MPMNTTTSTGQRFFCSVPNGVFNLELHRCEGFRATPPSDTVHQAVQCALGDKYAPICASYGPTIRCILIHRGPTLGARREEHRCAGLGARLRDSSGTAAKAKYSSHIDSFHTVCKDGELEIVKATVERAQVDLEASDGMT